MDFLTAKKLIAKRSHEDENDTEFLTLAGEWLNEIMQDIITRSDSWPFLEKSGTLTILAGTSSYPISSIGSDVRNIMNIGVGSSTKEITFKGVNPKVFFKVAVNPSGRSGTPVVYTTWEDEILLFPEPDAALTADVKYYKTLPDLSADTDTPGWDSQWDRVWITGALSLALLFNDDARWDTYYNLYERLLDRMEAGEGEHIEEQILSSNHHAISHLDNDDYDPTGILAGVLGP